MEGNSLSVHPHPSPEGMELHLEPEGEEGLQVDRKTLVGKVLVEKVLNKAVVKEIISKAWNLGEDLNIVDLGPNVYMFNFSRVKDAKRILEEGPWFIMGNLLNIQNWIPEVSVFEVNYDYVLFWVQFHGLPLDLMSTTNAGKIGKILGDVILVENPLMEGHMLHSFLRVRIHINIKKSLVTGFWLPRNNLPRLWIFAKCERLQGFYFNCGIVGHDRRRCKGEMVMSLFDPSKPRYGPNLGVPLAKSLASIAAENISRIRKHKETKEDDDVVEERDTTLQPSITTTFPQPPGTDSTENVPTIHVGRPNLQKAAGDKVTTTSKSSSGPTSVLPNHNIPFVIPNLDPYSVIATQPNSTTHVSTSDVPLPSHQEPTKPACQQALDVPTSLGLQTSAQSTLIKNNTTIPNPVPPQTVSHTHCPPDPYDPAHSSSLTTIDLRQQIPRPGLGPKYTADLGIQSEFFGLQREVVIHDYPSPKLAGQRQRSRTPFPPPPNTDSPYFVEFPPEDNEPDTTPHLHPSTNNISLLIVDFHQAVSLKRTRGQLEPPSEISNTLIEPSNKHHRKEYQSTPLSSPEPPYNNALYLSTTVSELKELCSKHKLTIVFLMETRAQPDKLDRIKHSLKFQNCFYEQPRGLSGGLALLWDKSVDIEITDNCPNFIHTGISWKEKSISWDCTFVYGNPIPSHRRQLWDHIRLLRSFRGGAWNLVGDFNDILHPEDKEGLRPPNMQTMRRFQEFVRDSELMDFELKGNKFTRFSNPRQGVITRERIDRVLVSSSWRVLFLNASACALPAISSDHSPIILDVWPTESSGTTFKYEQFWDDHPDCKFVVSQGWSGEGGDEEGWDKLLKRTTGCRRAILRWHHVTFRNAVKEIPKLKLRLSVLQNSTDISQHWDEILQIRKQLAQFWN
ncbi:Zinc knuckle CX2CX4HX4C [Sesbania bispinosa]|nr:Zinc knuckle CX2CX4HX4C [Sesbania bispinosa]